MLLVDEPDCRAGVGRLPAINVGLPRTATLWLSHVLAQLGVRSLHCNVGPAPAGVYSCVHPRGTSWRLAQSYKLALEQSNASLVPSWVHSYAAWGDLPWYFAPASLLQALAPNATYFASTRDVEAWLRSVATTLEQPLLRAIHRTNWSCATPPVYGTEIHSPRVRGPPLGAYLVLLEYSHKLFTTSHNIDALELLCSGRSGTLDIPRLRRLMRFTFTEHHKRLEQSFPQITYINPAVDGWLNTTYAVVSRLGLNRHCVNKTLAQHLISRPLKH